MKIVFQGMEQCGFIAELSNEAASRGHQVTTIADPDPYFDHQYDYSLSSLFHEKWRKTNLPFQSGLFAAKVLNRFCGPAYRYLSDRMRSRICLDAELYIQVWSGWPGEFDLLRRLRNKGVRIATLFMGSEIRHYPCFQQQFAEQDWTFPDYCDSPIDEKLVRLRMHEKLSDAIFSVPDQMGLALRPYHHLMIPVRTTGIDFHVPDRTIPLVVHAPTNRLIKGSQVIEETLEQLKEQGCKFDYLPLTKIPHNSLMKILSAADVLVDELLLHGPGSLGLEAMAAGCAVATRHLNESPPIFRPPVHSIDRSNIKDQLRCLLTNQELRRELGHQGREFVERNNCVSAVLDHVMERTLSGTDTEDYKPTYFSNFTPNEKDVASIRTTNKIVDCEPWFTETPCVAP